MNIVVIGHVCIDENISERATYTGAGSPAIFMQKIFRQFSDTNVTIVSSYGKDFSRYLHGIRIYPPDSVDGKTLRYKNISRGSKRVQYSINRNTALPVPIDESLSRLVAEADSIVVCPILPNFPVKYVRDLLAMSDKQTVKLLLPQGYFRKFDSGGRVQLHQFNQADSLFPHFDFVSLSREDYPHITELSYGWVRKFNTTIIMTEGGDGASVINAKEVKHIGTSAIPTEKIVDSVGSGDIFSAGFIYEYMKTKDITKAVRFANALAGDCLMFTPDRIRIDYKKFHLS